MSKFSDRRDWLCGAVALLGATLTGCGGASINTDGTRGERLATWGRRGTSPGRFSKPRGIAIDAQDRIYVVDMTARIQVFDADFNHLREWQTPTHEFGRPTGLSILRDGTLWVPDTHYYRLLQYDTHGKLLRMIGGTRGPGRGEFHFVTDVAELSTGELVISEYGEWDRIHLYSPDGTFIRMWGGHSDAPGEFLRPQSVAVDEQDRIWVADSCNHRLQIFDRWGKLLDQWGTPGNAPGQLSFPYGLYFDRDGNLVVCEYGNHRVQVFDRSGKSLGCWGRAGHGEDELFNPWGCAVDSRGRTIIVDSLNHRLQVVRL